MMTPAKIAQQTERLASLPEICTQLDKLLDNPFNTAQQMARLISQDVSLSARLLKIANSSVYGFKGRIDSIQRAITIIGTGELLILVLGTSAMMTFRNIPGNLFNMAGFWRHSVYCGVVAKQVAKRCNILHPERLFIAGLLHDIGLLSLCYSQQEVAKKILATQQATGLPLQTIEKNLLGFDHADIGYELAKQWQLPEYIQQVISWHYRVDDCPAPQLDAAIVHIANEITNAVEAPEGNPGYGAISESAWRLTGLAETDVDELLHDATPEFEEMLGILLSDVGY